MHTDTCFAPWRDALVPGDLVAFVFPSSECDAAVEKQRPCLVLEVHRNGAVPEAVVAYGTGAAASRRNARDELPVTLTEDLHRTNLRKPTRFQVRRTVRVPLSDARFVESAAGDAVIGRLPPALLDRLDRIRNGPPVRRANFLRRPHRRPFDGRAAGAPPPAWKGLRMIISPPFVEEATALARTLRPQLAALFDAVEPPLPGFATEAERWLSLCETDPEEALSEVELDRILAVLVGVMHARCVFALAERRRYGARPEVEVAGDLGGAVLAQVARREILRLVRRHDRERAGRLARNILRLAERQRSEIAELAAKRL